MNALTPISFKKGRGREPRLSPPRVFGRQHDRFWKAEEYEVVRRHYPSGGVAACLVHLPGRTPTGVYQVAKRLGLRSERRPETYERHDYGPAMDERIRAAWPELSGRGAVNGLADRLGVPRWWLSKRATILGLSLPHQKEPRWTEAEDALMRRVPLHDPHRCAEIFREHGYRRTPTAIVVRAKRLEISRRTHETLSARAVARILGVDDKHVTALCIAGDLVAGRRGTRRLIQQGGDAWAIEPAELRRYIIEHIDRIDIRKVEKFAFVALLTGSTGLPDRPAEPPPAAKPRDDVTVDLCNRVADLEQENLQLREAELAPSRPEPDRRIRRWIRPAGHRTRNRKALG